MIGLIFIILILFSIVWSLVWFWFFKNDKASIEKIYKSGDKAFEAGDYKKTKALLLSVPDLSANPDAKYKLGIAHLELGEYDAAKAIFEQILKTSPKNVGALSNLAKILQLQGKDNEALEAYSKIIKENSNDVNSYLAISDIYNKQGDYDKALETLEKIKSIVPDNAQVLFSIVKTKSASFDIESDDDYQQIIDEYTTLVGNPDLPKEFDIMLAKTYAKNGQIDEALVHCKKAIEINDSDIDAYRLLGLILLIKQDLAGAKNSLSMALNLKPSSVETHNIFSYLLCSQDKDCDREKCRKKYYKLIEKYIK